MSSQRQVEAMAVALFSKHPYPLDCFGAAYVHGLTDGEVEATSDYSILRSSLGLLQVQLSFFRPSSGTWEVTLRHSGAGTIGWVLVLHGAQPIVCFLEDNDGSSAPLIITPKSAMEGVDTWIALLRRLAND